MSRRIQPTEFDLLEIYVEEMERCGQSRNLIRLSVDDDVAERLRSKLGVEITLAQLHVLADKCLAHEWLEHTVHGGKYSALALTSTGLDVVRSRQRKAEAPAIRAHLKKVSDYSEVGEFFMASRRSATATPERPILTIEQKRVYVDRLKKRIEELDAFNPETVQKRFSSPEVMALENAIADALSAVFGHGTVEYNRYRSAAKLDHGPVMAVPAYGTGRPSADRLTASQYLAEGKQQSLALLRQAVRTLEEEIAEQQQFAAPTSTASAQRALERKVFVVHGHDEGAREAVARFVQKIGFEPIILHEQANQGRTVIEKVEAHGDVGFAVVLLTPDDEGSIKGGTPQPRARQNVLLELGYFVGRLGRKNVCALKRGALEIPSDFGGVVYEAFDDSGGWKMALGRELQAAGYSIDWNEVMRP